MGKYPRNERYDYDFKTNIVDNGCFPFSTWAHLSRRVLSEYSARLLEATGSVTASNLVSGALAALAAVCLYPPMVRRLHDLGRDARFARAYLCFGIPQGFLLGTVAALPQGSLGLYAFDAALAAVTLLFIVLIFHAGEPRRNVYGAVPGRAAAPRAERKRLGRKARSV